MTTTVENYAKFAERWKTTVADKIIRPPAATYTLSLLSLVVEEDTEFSWVKPKKGKLPSVSAHAKWVLEPSEEMPEGMEFPGRFWNIPVCSGEELESIPSNQQQRAEIQDGQFKSWVMGILGYEPDNNPFDDLKGFADTVEEAAKAGEPFRYKVRLRYNRKSPDDFERDVVDRQITEDE
jgi:hypothetical protein